MAGISMDEYVGQELANIGDTRPGKDLSDAGPACRRLRSIMGTTADRASALIGTQFWQAFMASPTSFNTIMDNTIKSADIRISPSQIVRAEKIVIQRYSEYRCDLLIFLPVPIKPTAFRIVVNPQQIFDGWQAWRRGRTNPLAQLNLALEAVLAEQPFGMVLTTQPMVQFSASPASIPAPCRSVSGGKSDGLVGAIVRNMKSSNVGITAAAHVVGTATSVRVDGKSGTVVQTDQIADACFVEMDLADLPAAGSKGAKGVMKDILPRGQEKVTFEALRSGNVETIEAHVTGWSLELPAVDLLNQLKIYTTLATNSGDSGTAVISADDYLLGFAHEWCDDILQYSSWIWADQVYEALEIESV